LLEKTKVKIWIRGRRNEENLFGTLSVTLCGVRWESDKENK